MAFAIAVGYLAYAGWHHRSWWALAATLVIGGPLIAMETLIAHGWHGDISEPTMVIFSVVAAVVIWFPAAFFFARFARHVLDPPPLSGSQVHRFWPG